MHRPKKIYKKKIKNDPLSWGRRFLLAGEWAAAAELYMTLTECKEHAICMAYEVAGVR